MGCTHAPLALVLERREVSQLDYLVNGVVVTERALTNDRLERRLRIPKLRGIRLAIASYPHTVEGARFQSVEPIRRYSELRAGLCDRETDGVPCVLWPGSRSLAEVFRLFPIGGTALFETDPEVPDVVVRHVLGPAIGS